MTANQPISRDSLYKAVNATIRELEEYLVVYDPLEIIGNIAHRILGLNPEEHAESDEVLWYPLIDYIMSLALAAPLRESRKHVDKETMEAILLLWQRLKSVFCLYFGTEYTPGENWTEAEVRFRLILDYFGVRGKGYSHHLEETFLGLFEQHRNHLTDILGFSAEDLNEFVHYAEAQVISSVKNEVESLESLLEIYGRFSEWMKPGNLPSESRESTMKLFFEQNPQLRSHKERISNISKTQPQHAFKISARNDLQDRILDAISCSFGDNSAFLEPEKWRGWPTNDTIVNERPVIKFSDEYYLFNPAMLTWYRVEILERLLRERSEDYYNNRYLPFRDRYIEKTALDLLRVLLPDSETYTDLYYHVEKDNKRKWVELDGLILYDDCLLLVEAKAGILPPPARRGSIMGLKDNVKHILSKGHSQATRALEYIHSAPKAEFFDEKGSPVVSVERGRFKHIYLILVTFEPMFALSSHLSSAKKLGLLPGERWPWAVYINDLRILTDIITHPTLFLHYLKRRIRLNDYPQVQTHNEIDYFEFYLHTGLYFSKDSLEEYDKIIVIPSTTEIDTYYRQFHEEGVSATKPVMKMEQAFEILLARLETERPVHFTSACFHLLNCDDETRSHISRAIRSCEERFHADEKPKSAAFRIDGTGLLLGCFDNVDGRDALAENWANKWLNQMNVDYVTVLLWTPPIHQSPIRLFEFRNAESSQ